MKQLQLLTDSTPTMLEALNKKSEPRADAAGFASTRRAKKWRSSLVGGAGALLLLLLTAISAADYVARIEAETERSFDNAERALATLQAIAAREYGVLDQVTASAAQALGGRSLADIPTAELRQIKSVLEAPLADSRVALNFWLPNGVGAFPETASVDLSDRDFIRAHEDPALFARISIGQRDGAPGLVVGAPVRSRLRDEFVFPVSRAVRDSNGRVNAIIAASVPTRAFVDAIAHQRRKPDDSIFLIRSDGTGMLRMPDHPDFHSRDFSGAAVFMHYPARQIGRYAGRGIGENRRRQGAFVGLSPLPLVAGYSFDMDTAAAQARAQMVPALYAGSVNLLGVMCFAGVAFAAVRSSERTAKDLEGERDRSIAQTQRLDAILETASDAIVILDSDFRISRYNRAAEATFGVPAADAIGGTIDRFLPDAARGGHSALMARQGQAPEFSRVMGNWRQVQARHSSGLCFPALISISKTSNATGATYMAIVRDMSEQLAAEQRLERLLAEQAALAAAASASDAAKSLFLATMSHELRTPLNAILGYSEALTLGYAGPIGSPKAREYVGDILRSGQHLHALIDRVLDLTRIQSGTDFDPSAATTLSEAIEESVRFVKIRASEKSIAIDITGDADGISVGGDSRRIVQVILNVLGNAIKFTPAGGRIEMTIERGDIAFPARLRVADSGPGMSEAMISQVGKPFVQERNLMVANNDGVGLGLSIVCEILSRLGGRIHFQNLPKGGLEVVVDFSQPRAVTQKR